MSTTVTIKPGAGGDESIDFARILFNMYFCWSKRHKTYVSHFSETGHKWELKLSVEPSVLQQEHGVHRFLRISPYDAQGRRHTSFAGVEVSGIEGVPEGPIRSYTLNPHHQATDVRKRYSTEKVHDVLAGGEELDWMIAAATGVLDIPGTNGAYIERRTLTKAEMDHALTLTPTIEK